MTWSFNNTSKTLTSTGATLASPDSLLAGIAAIQALDTARGYVSDYIGWINNVFISVTAGSFIQFDADSQIEFRGSTYIKIQGTTGGGIIHNYRSTLLLNLTTQRVDAAVSLPAGSTFKSLKERPNDPSPRIIIKHNVRYDYPTILRTVALNTVYIDGLDFYSNNLAFTALKLYFGQATNSYVNSVRIFNLSSTSSIQRYSTTYLNGYYESLATTSESAALNTIVENKPTFYLATPAPFSSNLWAGQITIRNPTFLNNCWNETVLLASSAPGLNAASLIQTFYTYVNFFKFGLTPLENIKVRFVRTVRSSVGSPTWATPANSTQSAITDVNGTFTAIDLLDFYRTGTSTTQQQRFKHEAKARKYEYKTAGETIFIDRFFYQGNVNLSNGYSEEVQMLQVPYLTLTEAQASALTGISIVSSGSTTGTVTISQNRTVAEIWQYYRYWISQLLNFNNNDTWNFDNSTLDVGGWNFVTSSVVTGNIKTTAVVTINTPGSITGVYTDSSGINISIQSPNILSGSRVQLYNLTNSVELYNGILSTNGFIYPTTYTSSITCRLRITKVGYLPIELTGVVTNTGLLFSGDNQVADTVYNTIGISGSTVTEFSTDYVNLQIDVSDLDYQTTFQRLYAWFRYIETTSLGISNYFNGLYATDEVNFVVRSSIISLKLDNVLTTPVKISGGALTRDDGQTIIASTSNSIQIDPSKSYIANSQFIVDKLNNIPTNTLTVSKFLALK